MTETDRVAFDVAFRAVVRVHGGRDWTEQAIVKLRSDYWDALEELPIALVQTASSELVRSATRWPKPVDWRHAAQRMTKVAALPAPAVAVLEDGTTEPTFVCMTCEDTGWRPECGCDVGRLTDAFRCPRHSPTSEDRRTVRMRVKPCECRRSNPHWFAQHQGRMVEDRGAA